MDIKKANVNLLLGKVGELLDALAVDKKNEKALAEAQKALDQLKDLFAGKDGEIELMACRSKIPVIDG